MTDSLTLTRAASNAGISPKRTTTVNDIAIVNPSTRMSGETAARIGIAVSEANASSADAPHPAMTTPNTPPPLARSTFSAKN